MNNETAILPYLPDVYIVHETPLVYFVEAPGYHIRRVFK